MSRYANSYKRGREMVRCSPVDMRKNLEVVEQFKRYGIDFVAVPVRNGDHKNELIELGGEVLEELAKGTENSEE
jgi:hypothetical protein